MSRTGSVSGFAINTSDDAGKGFIRIIDLFVSLTALTAVVSSAFACLKIYARVIGLFGSRSCRRHQGRTVKRLPSR